MLGTMLRAIGISSGENPGWTQLFCMSMTSIAVRPGSSDWNACRRPRIRTHESMIARGMLILCMPSTVQHSGYALRTSLSRRFAAPTMRLVGHSPGRDATSIRRAAVVRR